MPTREELQKGFCLGDFEVLPTRRVIRRGDEEISPDPRVFEVLMSLSTRDGGLVSRDEPINRAAAQ